MEQTGVQQQFFQQIKKNLPSHLSFVDEIADLLEISSDSAYRRIRGEKPISFEEIQKLSGHYKISLDQFLHLKSDLFIFSGKLAAKSGEFFGEWINDLLQKIEFLNSFEKKHLYFLTKDLPFISFFQIPELSSFKFFMWMRSFLNYEDLRRKKLSFQSGNKEYEAIGEKIIRIYNQIPTTEIWNIEGINTTIHQIEFYKDSDLFETKEDVLLIYNKLEELINHFEQQAIAGKKFNIGERPGPHSAEYNVFHNDLWLGDNSFLADLGTIKVSFLNHSVIHYIITHDENFNNYLHESILNMTRKSTQISVIGEKNRSRFFNRMREKINFRKKAVFD
jgi:BetR domain